MTHTGLSALATLATIAGPIVFLRGFKDLRVLQLVKNTPTARIRSMAIGMVELHGAVEARSALIGPFSGRPCVFWQVEIEARSGKRGWRTVHRAQSGSPFFMRDETGVALVMPAGADCRVAFGVSEETMFGAPDCYEQYMASAGLGMRHLWKMGPMRFRERLLEPGSVVYVLGRAYPKPQAEVLSAGDIDLEATGTDAWRARRVRGLDDEIAGVVRRGPNDPVFLMRQDPELLIETEFTLRAFAGVIGGPVMAVGGLAFVLWLMSNGAFFR